MVLQPLDWEALDNLERTMLWRRRVSAHEIRVSVHELFAAERKRRESGEAIAPSDSRPVAGLDQWKLYGDLWPLPLDDVRRLANVRVTPALAEVVKGDVERIKRIAALVIDHREAGVEPPLI